MITIWHSGYGDTPLGIYLSKNIHMLKSYPCDFQNSFLQNSKRLQVALPNKFIFNVSQGRRSTSGNNLSNYKNHEIEKLNLDFIMPISDTFIAYVEI